MSWLWLPHSVTHAQGVNSTRGGPSVAGDDGEPSTRTISVQVADPLTPEALADKYGLLNRRQGYLIIGDADDFDLIAEGDVLTWGDKDLQVAAKPKIFRPGDGYDSGELIAEDMTRGITR